MSAHIQTHTHAHMSQNPPPRKLKTYTQHVAQADVTSARAHTYTRARTQVFSSSLLTSRNLANSLGVNQAHASCCCCWRKGQETGNGVHFPHLESGLLRANRKENNMSSSSSSSQQGTQPASKRSKKASALRKFTSLSKKEQNRAVSFFLRVFSQHHVLRS